MALLNGYEGPARVVVEREDSYWKGYILLKTTRANFDAFAVAGPIVSVIYEGPVLIAEQYVVATGEARVVHLQLGSEKMKVEFEGSRSLSVGKTLPGQPPDFLSKE